MKDREMIWDALTSGKPARVGIALLMAAGYFACLAIPAWLAWKLGEVLL